MKNKFKPTTEEAFAVGKLEGQREAFTEIQEMVSGEFSTTWIKAYLKARLKFLTNQNVNNPFKRDSK